MPRRIAESELNASTIDILNVIRRNASAEYRNQVPAITKETDIPKVGEIIYGTPGIANEFLGILNRIALVAVQSATFNNPYAHLKKGYLEFGETVEEIFVNIMKAYSFSAEKGEQRELKRYLPDVRTAFHVINYRVMYPVTIEDEQLRMAFLSAEGVRGMIADIVEQVYTAAEYDEFLLFKYMIIKAVSHGKMYPVTLKDTDPDTAAVAFRGWSNSLEFMGTEYNESSVKTNTPKSRQVIFMDAHYNAEFDVKVLAGAFNMDKADFMGRLHLIDDWTSFDMDRFSVIMENSDSIEPITAAELTAMSHVKAVLLDEKWFQFYDNLNKFTEKYIASGLYWNYFYHQWKIISNSPFANAIVVLDSTATTTLPTKLTCEILSKTASEEAVIFTLSASADGATLAPNNVKFIQTEALTKAGIAVQEYGAIIIPASQVATNIVVVAEVGGVTYTAKSTDILTSASDVGDTLELDPPTA